MKRPACPRGFAGEGARAGLVLVVALLVTAGGRSGEPAGRVGAGGRQGGSGQGVALGEQRLNQVGGVRSAMDDVAADRAFRDGHPQAGHVVLLAL
jgi:hypothetical protein